MENSYRLSLRRWCIRFIGRIGETIFENFINSTEGLACKKIFVHRAGYGDYVVLKKELFHQYDSLVSKFGRVRGKALDFENKNTCRVEVKSSLDKFSRYVTLSKSEKERPKFDYIVRVNIRSLIKNGFIGTINQKDLEPLFENPKIAIDKDALKNTDIILSLKNCKDLIFDVGQTIIEQYFTSTNYGVSIRKTKNDKNIIFELFSLKNEDPLITDKINRLSVGLNNINGNFHPRAHEFSNKYLIKCETYGEARRKAHQLNFINLGSTQLLESIKYNEEIRKFYDGSPWYIWDYKKQIKDYEKLILKHRVKIKTKIEIDNYKLPITYNPNYFHNRFYIKYNSNKYDYQLILRICNDFSKGFSGIFTSTQLDKILKDKRLG